MQPDLFLLGENTYIMNSETKQDSGPGEIAAEVDDNEDDQDIDEEKIFCMYCGEPAPDGTVWDEGINWDGCQCGCCEGILLYCGACGLKLERADADGNEMFNDYEPAKYSSCGNCEP
jgi:hypothetical protein